MSPKKATRLTIAKRTNEALAWARSHARRPWRIVIPLLGAAVLCGLLYLRILDERVPWQINERAPRDIVAHADTWYEDTQATERRKRDARAGVEKEYDERKAAAAAETRDDISKIRVLADKARGDQDEDLARLNQLRDSLLINLSHNTLSTLVTTSSADVAVIEDLAHKLADEQMQQAIHDQDNELQAARERIAESAARLSESQPLRDAAVEIAQKTIRVNHIYNRERTVAGQKEAEDEVKPVRAMMRRNEPVIAAGDTVEQIHIDKLRALGMTTRSGEDFYPRVLASVATVIGLLSVFLYYLYRFRRQFIRSSRCVGLLVGSFVTVGFIARLGSGSSAFEATELAAVAALAIVLAALLDTEVAMVASVFMAFFADMAAPGSDPRLLVAAAMAGTIAAFASGAGGSRTSVIVRTMVICTVANCFVAGAVSSVFGLPIHSEQLGFAAVGGVVASLVAAGAILVLERPLKITTEVRLLELSSPSTPVLRRLALEAPGTYAASVAVANLAETAAEAVGADPLLTRLGSYYHDIGKLKRPYYFIENQQGLTNPHDRLTAHLSAKIIISHVRDGLETADEMGLPAEVRAFIAEHHGTTLVEYFYEKALQEADEGAQVQESLFRYDGPKPQTRETAILMVADTVEAASRTIAHPDLDGIETLVKNLIEHKIDDGQFDECDLTFADIHTVQDSMVRTLMAAFHQRIKYPAQLEEETSRRPEAAK